MIRLIVAVDNKNGIANENGIPWNLPSEKKYYRDKIKSAEILMGAGVYKELKQPANAHKNFVLTHKLVDKPGFYKVSNTKIFFKEHKDVWVIGGQSVYDLSIELADEIYITRIDQDFKCTKFFPEIDSKFQLVSRSPKFIENNIDFYYEVYKKIDR
jgi:dihydrofolate reductase